jgi:hypothetical protein
MNRPEDRVGQVLRPVHDVIRLILGSGLDYDPEEKRCLKRRCFSDTDRPSMCRGPIRPKVPEDASFTLTDGVWDRLQCEAIRRKSTVSAIARGVLDRSLSRFKVERKG